MLKLRQTAEADKRPSPCLLVYVGWRALLESRTDMHAHGCQGCSWDTLPMFSPVSLPTGEQDICESDEGAYAVPAGRSVYSLEGSAPYYSGVGPSSFWSDPCAYSVHQGAIGGKQIVHVRPVVVTTVDDVPSHMSWTAIIKNTAVEDDPVLSAIPYFGDDDREGVDLSLYYKDATREEEHDPVHDKLILLCGDKYNMTDVALVTASEMLSRSSSYLKERYEALCADRMEQQSKEPKAEMGATPADDTFGAGRLCAAIVDGFHGASATGSSFQSAPECRGLETYTAMFCRRCFKYDCHFHGIYHPQSSMKDVPAGRPSNRKAAANREVAGLPAKCKTGKRHTDM